MPYGTGQIGHIENSGWISPFRNESGIEIEIHERRSIKIEEVFELQLRA
jgi:hypothetical protein